MSQQDEKEVRENVERKSLVEFLESNPPNQVTLISDLGREHRRVYDTITVMKTPEIQLHCSDEQCNGIRFFRCIKGENQPVKDSGYSFFFLTYQCSNCQKFSKTYSIAAKVDKEFLSEGECYKFGELPSFGPPVSSRLIKMVGPDREEFLSGRRCENQGLGVGAFVYYRRVVENQKNRILNQIIKVAEKIGASKESLGTLKKAVEENQFSKALEMAKPAIPESLLINGHNPMGLLHSALSEGVHNLTDEECLTIAGSVRVVLGELSERLSQALKDEAELTKALDHLMNRK